MPIKQELLNNKYNRTIIGLDGTETVVDVYRILDAFEVHNPQLQHLVKKALATGVRGHKSFKEDLIDIRDSINSAILMEEQKCPNTPQ